jgi:hypothetical protein
MPKVPANGKLYLPQALKNGVNLTPRQMCFF